MHRSASNFINLPLRRTCQELQSVHFMDEKTEQLPISLFHILCQEFCLQFTFFSTPDIEKQKKNIYICIYIYTYCIYTIKRTFHLCGVSSGPVLWLLKLPVGEPLQKKGKTDSTSVWDSMENKAYVPQRLSVEAPQAWPLPSTIMKDEIRPRTHRGRPASCRLVLARGVQTTYGFSSKVVCLKSRARVCWPGTCWLPVACHRIIGPFSTEEDKTSLLG